jgi:hypothetical protein
MNLRFPTESFTDQPGKPVVASKIQSWFLIVFKSANVYRLELALPITCSDGQFVDWGERVFIDEIALDSEPKLDAVQSPLPQAPPKPRRRKSASKDEPKLDAVQSPDPPPPPKPRRRKPASKDEPTKKKANDNDKK